MAKEKQRLDVALFQRGLAPSREKARAMIMAAEVRVNGEMRDKPGTKVLISDELSVKTKRRFVSRGGEKLAGALTDFNFDVSNRICADVGASTGGFTDCLLQNQVQRIYAIDVGYGQIDYALRQNEHVIVMERTNARYVESLPEPINLVVVDASFISLRLLLPVIKNWLAPKADVIMLIKPQFEAGKGDVGKGGVVRDSSIHSRVIFDVCKFATNIDFHVLGLTKSPLKGPAGNVEFLAWLGWGHDVNLTIDIDQHIKDVTAD